MRRHYQTSLKRLLLTKARRKIRGNTILGYDLELPRGATKRALLSYLVPPVVDRLNADFPNRFSNAGLGVTWPRVLNELGYIVDIINWDDSSFVPYKEYDLVVFHGGKNFQTIYPALKGSPKIIHWMTGSYWKFNNSQEDARLANFYKRTGKRLPRERYVSADEDSVDAVADQIIALGNRDIIATFPKNQPVSVLDIATYPDKHFTTVERNYSEARNNFLFFSGSGNVHKGLDLILEAFRDLDQHLYVVTPLEDEFVDLYKDEFAQPNIHPIGELPMRTPELYDIMSRCAFSVLPSCSEGQAGSVVESMVQGLIPLVTPETHLDIEGFGHLIELPTIDNIRKLVQKVSAEDPTRIAEMARHSYRSAITTHSPETFRINLKRILRTSLD